MSYLRQQYLSNDHTAYKRHTLTFSLIYRRFLLFIHVYCPKCKKLIQIKSENSDEKRSPLGFNDFQTACNSVEAHGSSRFRFNSEAL